MPNRSRAGYDRRGDRRRQVLERPGHPDYFAAVARGVPVTCPACGVAAKVPRAAAERGNARCPACGGRVEPAAGGRP
jgi:transcription elongation factor Elf1